MGAVVDGIPNSNCTLSYTTKSNAYSFGTKVRGIASGWSVLATESHARLHRAFYPMQKTEGPFQLTMDLNGYTEFHKLMTFLINYVGALLGTAANAAGTPQTSAMTVLAAQPDGLGNFFQIGIPFTGMYDDDHVGSMVFNPTVVFMPVLDPSSPTIYNNATGAGGISWEDFTNTDNGDASQFYYPRSAGESDPTGTSQSLYDIPPQNASNGNTNSGSSNSNSPIQIPPLPGPIGGSY